MSAPLYFSKITKVIQDMEKESMPAIQKAAGFMADSIAAGRAVYYFWFRSLGDTGFGCFSALRLFCRSAAYP